MEALLRACGTEGSNPASSEQLADLPKAEADALIRAMAPGEANAFEYHWRYRARPGQLPPAGSYASIRSIKA
jgi:hypothetical protein